jgi:hypothetical protein
MHSFGTYGSRAAFEQGFALAVPELPFARDARYPFYQFVVEERRPCLEAVRHRGYVDLREKIARQVSRKVDPPDLLLRGDALDEMGGQAVVRAAVELG